MENQIQCMEAKWEAGDQGSAGIRMGDSGGAVDDWWADTHSSSYPGMSPTLEAYCV